MRPVITLAETIDTCFQNLMKGVGTSIPATVLSFDSSDQTAQIQIAISGVSDNGDVFEQQPILSVPVFFQGSSNFSIQHEVKAGDEGIAIFSQRCIDNWLSKGSGNPPSMYRFHDFNDAMFLCGLRSNPKRISSFDDSGIGIFKNDGSQKISIKNDGTIEITTTGKAEVNGSEFLTGGIINCNAITCTGVVTSASVATGGLSVPPPPAGEPAPEVVISSDITVKGNILVDGTVDGVDVGSHTHPVSGATTDGATFSTVSQGPN